MRIGQVARSAGVNIETLRYYERRGLLPEPARASSGYRHYPDDSVQVVRFIKRAQQLGFSLDEIGDLSRLARGGPASCREVRALAGAKIADMERRIETLQTMCRSLQALVDTCHRRPRDRTCPLIEAIGRQA
jgi:MerR family mercuric resistance operon transcriptional regulator